MAAVLDVSGEAYYRAIAPDISGYNLQAEVTVSEDHDDELLITEHPVEIGAIMSDHAYKRPPECRLRVGWSNSFGGYAQYAQAIYKQVIQLQELRQLFTLYTGKRMYRNMLIASVREVTEAQTEFAFVADIFFRQVFLAATKFTSPSGNASASTISVNNADPTKTLPTSDTGQSYTAQTNAAVTGSLPQPPASGASIAATNSNGGGAGPPP